MKFDKNGDGLGRYNIYNFQRKINYSTTGSSSYFDENGTSSPKIEWEYKVVGNWSENLNSESLSLNMYDLHVAYDNDDFEEDFDSISSSESDDSSMPWNIKKPKVIKLPSIVTG